MKRGQVRTAVTTDESTTLVDFDVAADFDSSVKIQDPQRAAAAAQALIYHNRLAEAAEVLEPFGETLDQGLALKDAAELGLARSELAYWKGLYDDATRLAQYVAGIFRLIGDPLGAARAAYMSGRVERRQGNFESARQELQRARELIDASPDPTSRFYLGCIDYNFGVIHQQLGELEEAEADLLKALAALNSTERGRYYAIALNSYGVLLKSKGQYEEATATYHQAISLLSQHASFDDLAHAINNLAYVQILLGKWEEAEKNVLESLELRRRAGDIAGEAGTLELLGRLNLERGDFPEAEKSFRSSIETAQLARNEHERAQALIGMGRVLNRTSRPLEAKGYLKQAQQIAGQLKSRMLEALSSAYLAETAALLGLGSEAQSHLTTARQLVSGYGDRHLMGEIDRLEQSIRGEGIRASDGVFNIKGSSLPTWRGAHDALGRFMLTEALQQSGGSQVGAARILGVTKAYITMLRRKYVI